MRSIVRATLLIAALVSGEATAWAQSGPRAFAATARAAGRCGARLLHRSPRKCR